MKMVFLVFLRRFPDVEHREKVRLETVILNISLRIKSRREKIVFVT